MRILVTGATGCLGRNLCRHLHEQGYSVLGTGRNTTIGSELRNQGIDFQQCDLSQPDFPDDLLDGCDVVVHCAALSSAWGRIEDFVQANVIATKNLLAACFRKDIRRFVYISTTSVYFNYKDRFGIAETDHLADHLADPMVNAYAATKYQAECLVQNANSGGMPTIIIRPRAIFGPYDRSLFPRIIGVAAKGFFPLPDNGDAIIDITYVDNVVHAIHLAIEAKDQALGKIFNISNGEPQSVRNILKQLFKATGQNVRLIPISANLLMAPAVVMERLHLLMGGDEPVLTPYKIGLLSKSQTLNINAARKTLGYNPHISIAQGIERFASWWKKVS